MANIKAVLEINDYDKGAIKSIQTSSLFNNVSLNGTSNEIKIESSLPNMKKNDGMIGTMILGDDDTQISKIDETQKLAYQDANGYNGYMWGLTDKNGYLKCDLVFYGVNLGDVIIYFDKTANQYPTEYTVTQYDGSTTTISNNTSTNIIVTFKSNSDYKKPQSVTFTKWHQAKTNASVTFIEFTPSALQMPKNWIENLETETQSVSNNESIEYGCLSNTGSISLIDVDGTLLKKAELGYLDINAFKLSLYLNNKLIQTHISSSSPYYSNNYTYDINLSNDIKLWENIEIDEREYEEEVTLYDLLSYIIEMGGIKIDLSKEIIVYDKSVSTIENYLKDIVINATEKNPFTLKKDTLRNQLDKICTVAQLNIIEDDDGTLIAISARPRATDKELENYLVINNSMQYERPVSTILVSNKYDDVIIK